ncbi:MAG TPA: class I SAM-dependent methyltransferase [Microthrixaceae bacterium]|nr:class I SAM-dependent methyltransferase [Microthrixaceae bacterium]
MSNQRWNSNDVGDLLTADLPAASFDVVSSVGMLHHVDQAEGVAHLGRLVRPGDAARGRPRSIPLRARLTRDAFDSHAVRRHTLSKGVWETPSPQDLAAPMTYAETRDVSLDALRGARFRRLPYFRYGLT